MTFYRAKKSLIKENSLLLSLACITAMGILLAYSGEVRLGIYNGLLFSFTTVIPTLFPFFVLSELLTVCFDVEQGGIGASLFRRCFGVNGEGIKAFVLGSVCGFPVGARISAELYDKKIINKDEMQSLVGFTNNPSLAFVISGVGGGILKDIKGGILLYISLVFSAILTGMIYKCKRPNTEIVGQKPRQSYNFATSIKNAGLNSITVASCIALFSGILGISSVIIKSEPVTIGLSILLELSNSVKQIAASEILGEGVKRILIAASLGFSGFSVHLQAFSFLPKDFSYMKYLLSKATQGILCALVYLISSTIFTHF